MTGFVEIKKGHLFSPEEAAKRRFWAEEFADKFRGVARAYDYAIFRGGSMVRDLDLVALPWSGHCLQHLDFVLEMRKCLHLEMGNHEPTVHGHYAYALWEPDHPTHQIDLKVVLPTKFDMVKIGSTPGGVDHLSVEDLPKLHADWKWVIYANKEPPR